jgi:hypothetical protein
MIRKEIILLIVFIFLLFVGLGDRIPYPPISNASLKTRVTLNKFVMGIFHKPEPRKNPYEDREKQIDEIERSGKSQKNSQ